MKILLIEAPYSYTASGKEVVGSYYPLGLGYLASYIRQSGYSIKIFQPSSEKTYIAELKKFIESFAPDVVGISVMTPSYPGAVEICNMIKEMDENIYTVLGGHHVSAVGKEVMVQSTNTDFSVIGEGEITFHELIEAIELPEPDFGKINGLAWKDRDGNIYVNEPRPLIKDVDSLPFPARDLVDMDKYRMHSYLDFGKKSATMISSRGCPYKCMFCSSWLTMGAQYRIRSVESIISEIKELVSEGVDHIIFEDDTMTLKRTRMFDLCDALIKMPDRPSWYCLSRVDTMDYALAVKMKEAGCRMVNFGIESGSPEIIKEIGKRISLDKAVDAIRACRKAGLRTQCTFIVGFPSDTENTMARTYEFAKKVNPTIAIFFPLTPYPGTKAYNTFLNSSMIPNSIAEWQTFIVTDSTGGISINKNFTGPEIKQIASKFNRKFFMRLSHWPSMLRTISNFSDFMRLSRGGIYLLVNYMKEIKRSIFQDRQIEQN